MFGPRFEIPGANENGTVVMKEFAGRDISTLPVCIEADVARYLSPERRRQVEDVLSWGGGSDYYRQLKEDSHLVVWGIHVPMPGRTVLAGCTGFNAYGPEVLPEGWRAAESAMIIMRKDSMGKGLARTTHPYRSVFALGMGLDFVDAVVMDGNAASERALQRVGYVPIGKSEDVDDSSPDRTYTTYRLYNPELGEKAVRHALAAAEYCQNPDLTEDTLHQAFERIEVMQKSLPHVQVMAQHWAKGGGNVFFGMPQSNG